MYQKTFDTQRKTIRNKFDIQKQSVCKLTREIITGFGVLKVVQFIHGQSHHFMAYPHSIRRHGHSGA